MSKDSVPSQDGQFSGDGFVRDKSGRGYPIISMPTHMATADPTLARERLLAAEGSGDYPNIKHPNKARQHALVAGESIRQRKDRPRSTKLAVLGIPASILDAGSQEYARTVRLASGYKKARQRELFQAHGYVSSGVGALLAAASLALSGSRYLYEIAANLPIQPAERGDLSLPAILKMASSLGDSARQNELSAWELCAREAVIRRRNENNSLRNPWEVVESTETVKRGPGRPRRAIVVEDQCQNQPLQNDSSPQQSESQDSDQLP
jgi:hypothetical protein